MAQQINSPEFQFLIIYDARGTSESTYSFQVYSACAFPSSLALSLLYRLIFNSFTTEPTGQFLSTAFLVYIILLVLVKAGKLARREFSDQNKQRGRFSLYSNGELALHSIQGANFTKKFDILLGGKRQSKMLSYQEYSFKASQLQSTTILETNQGEVNPSTDEIVSTKTISQLVTILRDALQLPEAKVRLVSTIKTQLEDGRKIRFAIHTIRLMEKSMLQVQIQEHCIIDQAGDKFKVTIISRA